MNGSVGQVVRPDYRSLGWFLIGGKVYSGKLIESLVFVSKEDVEDNLKKRRR